MTDAPHDQPEDKSHMLKPNEARIVLYIFAGMVIVAAMLVYRPQIQALLYPPQAPPLKLDLVMHNALHHVFQYKHTNGAFPAKLSETEFPQDQFEAEGYRIDDSVLVENGIITLWAYPIDKDSGSYPAMTQAYVDGGPIISTREPIDGENRYVLKPRKESKTNSPQD